METVINLPKDLFEKTMHISKDGEISDVVEMALPSLVKNAERAERDQRELDLLNANADVLNEEAWDVLEYQQVNW